MTTNAAITLSPAFDEACQYALEHHPDHAKGTGIPVMAHLIGVASLALEAGGDEDVAIAALLHDVDEDAGGQERLDEISERFGARVATIVAQCSDSLSVDPDDKAPWQERKSNYLDHLANDQGLDDGALRVSIADKTYNLLRIARDVDALDAEKWSRFKTGRDGQHWYFAELIAIYRRRCPGSVLLPLLEATFAQVFGEGAR